MPRTSSNRKCNRHRLSIQNQSFLGQLPLLHQQPISNTADDVRIPVMDNCGTACPRNKSLHNPFKDGDRPRASSMSHTAAHFPPGRVPRHHQSSALRGLHQLSLPRRRFLVPDHVWLETDMLKAAIPLPSVC